MVFNLTRFTNACRGTCPAWMVILQWKNADVKKSVATWWGRSCSGPILCEKPNRRAVWNCFQVHLKRLGLIMRGLWALPRWLPQDPSLVDRSTSVQSHRWMPSQPLSILFIFAWRRIIIPRRICLSETFPDKKNAWQSPLDVFYTRNV